MSNNPKPAFVLTCSHILRASGNVNHAVKTAPRKFLIEFLRWNDPNGYYSDEDTLAEVGRVSTLDELRGVVRGWQTDKLRELSTEALRTLTDAGWGSKAQIESENTFFTYARGMLGRKQVADLESYLNKGTTEEAIAYALELVDGTAAG